jgi:hypothetical protein
MKVALEQVLIDQYQRTPEMVLRDRVQLKVE